MANKNLMPFLEAVREGVVKEGDRVDWISCYPLNDGIVKLIPEETGWVEEQIFDRNQEQIVWRFHKDSKGIPTLYASTTKFRLILRGNVGYNNGQAVLNKIACSYANPNIGIDTRSAKVGDEKNLIIDKRTWLSTKKVSENDEVTHYGFADLDYGYIDYDFLFHSNGDFDSYYYGIRPVASIHTDDVLLDINSYEPVLNKWTLYPPESV